ncbi:MAG: T9SS type A sorting domain-containing protein [Bacteroidia bacterium]
MRSLFLLLFLLINATASAQHYTDRYWAFGDSAGINFKNLQNPAPASSILRCRGTCASICDSTGDLLFYCGSPNWQQWLAPNNIFTDGYVINKNHQVMESGDSLATTGWYQEMVIVPMPGNDSLFYIFCAGASNASHGMYYSIIDVKYNNGQGRVIQKNVQLRNDTLCDGITAVRHGNGRDWWVIVRSWKTYPVNDITAYLISPSGVTINPTQYIGTLAPLEGFYRMKFNSDGSHLYNVSARGIVERLDFDRCTGIFSNPLTYCGLGGPNVGYWGFEISPDESKLYTSLIYQTANADTAYILQFDLNAPNFLASADTLGTFTAPDTPGLLELGPDGKIYVSTTWAGGDTCYDYLYCYGTVNITNSNLSMINFPDSAGAACGFQPFSFNLGGHKAYVGLPNNHNYELGAWVGSPCDTLSVGIPELFHRNGELKLYYDKSWQTLFANAEQLQGKNAVLQFYNLNGQLIDEVRSPVQGGYFTYSTSFAAQPNGLYIVRLQTEGEMLTGKFVKW